MNGRNRAGLARLFSDGTLDETFDPGAGFTNGAMFALESDGDILAAAFGTVDLTAANGLVRLEGDAGVDSPRLEVARDGQRLIITSSSGGMQLEVSDNLTSWTTVKVFTETDRQYVHDPVDQRRFFRSTPLLSL